jgi:hypothetical protein
MVQLKDSICFKWVQKHGSSQGFNLLQMSPKTWFNSRIQFASNESKLVPRNLDLRTPSKVGLT